MKTIRYERDAAVSYAKRWAFGRNPAYYDFSRIGGDCTNFVSQCVFAGSGVMNETPVLGWYYKGPDRRTASWTGVEYLYNFLISNQGTGPFAQETTQDAVGIGDVIQLGRETGDFYHTCIVTGFRTGTPLVAAHSSDAFGRPLTSYIYEKARCLHIGGVRTES